MHLRVFKHVVPTALLGWVILAASGCQSPRAQTKFSTPESAAAALQEALNSETLEKMQAVFGRKWMEVCASGDPVADRQDREVLALAMNQSWHWASRGEDARELIIGKEEWPFPVPLVRSGNAWRFDSAAGKDEVLARRIGRNELNVISLCHGYVKAQKEYASQSHDGKPPGRFAQRFRSTPGLQDGLFWHLKRGDRASPFGELVTAAIREGYDPNSPAASPFRGYRFRILTAQGPAAPGGSKSYVIDGDMTGGFALIAYPALYGSSGIMTFIVGQDGVVFQKDLGEQTATLATALSAYDPDNSWTRVEVP